MRHPNPWFYTLLVLLLAAFVVGCTSGSSGGAGDSEHDAELTPADSEHEHDADLTPADSEHEHPNERVPNNGAVIRIISPVDNATFKAGTDIVVEVEIENFAIGVDGNHWHVFVDEIEYSMVTGQNTDEVLRGVAAGEHVISVYLANGNHQDLEEGDSITIQVQP